MKVIYIGGPFRAANTWEIEQNVRRAEEVALEVWRLGAAAICPHANTRFFQRILPDSVWLDGDLEIIARCDALLLQGNWQNSAGTLGEIEQALSLGLPIFDAISRLKKWLENQSA
jgi:hypothetical protein